MSDTCSITTKNGQQRTLTAKAKKDNTNSYWKGYVMDEDAGFIVLTVVGRCATEEDALRDARIAMDDFAYKLGRKLRRSR